MKNANDPSSPFLSFTQEEWRELAATTALPLTPQDVERLSSLGDPIDFEQADAIYRPLSAVMQMYARHTGKLFNEMKSLLGFSEMRTPWVVGVAGSVAVGKSTTARLLRELLRRWPQTPHVDLVPTDGFLLPNAELERRGIMDRKGFPESYDRKALLRFLSAVKAGEPRVRVPVYDHMVYDIVPGEFIEVDRPEILIVEGLNVLQPPRLSKTTGEMAAVSDFFDFSIYVDAAEEHLRDWYITRFLKLRQTAFSDERSFFRNYADLDDNEARTLANEIWEKVNLPNLVENIAPTRSRATVVLTKGSGHSVERIELRKI